jgi:hypothetical protein
MPLPRRGTEPYAVAHARQVASHWDIPVIVARRGDRFFCAVAGTSLNDVELVGRAAAGGKMFVYEGSLAVAPNKGSTGPGAGSHVTAEPPLGVIGKPVAGIG